MIDLPAHVRQSIRQRKLFRRGQRILVAVSGGVDSMALLRVLHALAAEPRWQLTVAHFNHQLRGRGSDADERLVRQTASALDLPFVAGRADVKRHAKGQGLSLEMAARELRHAFLARAARRGRIPVIALAHHVDDQVELFFLRALRGAGGEGLAGMKWSSSSPADAGVRLVRPLLDVSKRDLAAFALERRIGFREDATNASRDFQRNRLRHELIPLLRHRFQPALDQTVPRLMEIVGAEAEVVTLAARRWLQRRRRPSFARLLLAIQRRVLQLQLLERNVAADFETLERLRQFPNRPVSLSPALSVFRDDSGRVRTRTHRAVSFNATRLAVPLGHQPGEVRFGGVRFRWRFDTVRGCRRLTRAGRTECFDADRVGGQVLLRHWQPGDRFHPIGLGAPVKLQDWFTNRRVPRARRHEMIVAATAGDELFWVEDQRISENFKLTPRSKRRLVWRWQRLPNLPALAGSQPRL